MNTLNLKKFYTDFKGNLSEWISPEGSALRERAYQELKLLAPKSTILWRGTNRRDEFKEVKAGLQIFSKNHADGSIEKGMSVSQGLGTVWGYGYKSCYKVSGELVEGGGSDGEPVLLNVKVTGRNMRAETALKNDKEKEAFRGRLKALAEQLGCCSFDQLLRLYYMR